jgi:hypothetical protein
VTRLAARQSGGLRSALASAGAASATNLSDMLQRTTAAVKVQPPFAGTSAACLCAWARSSTSPALTDESGPQCWREAQPLLLIGNCPCVRVEGSCVAQWHA